MSEKSEVAKSSLFSKVTVNMILLREGGYILNFSNPYVFVFIYSFIHKVILYITSIIAILRDFGVTKQEYKNKITIKNDIISNVMIVISIILITRIFSHPCYSKNFPFLKMLLGFLGIATFLKAA